ncbi:MAG: hypothetical protein FVQ79_06450 [Planctomycetes bacterium]|nr:hypothetical protein [Planctomycetota bacterium]
MKDKNTANAKIVTENAVWAAKLYLNSAHVRPKHPRTLHYGALNIDSLSLPDGRPYVNTPQVFTWLEDALQNAQLLGLIPYDAFDHSCSAVGNDVTIPIGANSKLRWKHLLMLKIEKACASYLRCAAAIMMPVHVEIWLENTKGAALIESLAGRYHLNILSGTGRIPLRLLWDFVRRVSAITKPVRILYLSDLTGEVEHSIPAEMTTRSILKQYGLNTAIDLKFRRIGLTDKQRSKFKLSPAPDTDISACTKPDKTSSCGGIYELYSLEAVKAGMVEKMLEKYLKRYLGKGLISHIGRQTDIAMTRLASVIGQIIDKNTEVAETIRKLESSLRCGF